MKLIIEIPEMAYDAYKEWHKNKVATVEQSLIANGIPYEEKPQGDSISREALKKWVDDSISQYCNQYSTDMLNMFGLFKEVIDNAPTVEYTFEEAFQKTVCEQRLYCPARPQGEWKKLWSTFECPFCDKRVIGTDLNFCCKCGAKLTGSEKMKGGAE